MKKILCTLMAVMLACCCLMMSASAVDRTMSLVVDEAGVLAADELELLNEKADALAEQYQCEVAIAYVETLNGADIMYYADDFFDYNGYGYGDGKDGMILVVAMEEREYWMSCHGKGSTYFGSSERDDIAYRFRPYMSEGDWYNAAVYYLMGAEQVLNEAVQPPSVPPTVLAFDGVLAFLASLVPMGIFKAQLKPVAEKMEASQYVAKNGVNFIDNRDIFLRSDRRVRRIERETRSGGDHSHTSSSGQSHTGSGGHF